MNHEEYKNHVINEFAILLKNLEYQGVRKTKKGKYLFYSKYIDIYSPLKILENYFEDSITEYQVLSIGEGYFTVSFRVDLDILLKVYESTLIEIHYERNYSQYALLKNRPEFEMDDPEERFNNDDPFKYPIFEKRRQPEMI